MNFPSFRRHRQPGFAEAVIASFPEGLAPPEPLVSYFRWLEALNADRTQGDMRFAPVDPGQSSLAMLIQPVDPGFVAAWVGAKEAAPISRLAPFVRTGGDGSYAGLWRDDSDRLRFVHLGSGSGSTLLCTLVDDPVDFLRLLAIGYEELCWPEFFEMTPDEVRAAQAADTDAEIEIGSRRRMRAWVEATFGVIVPGTAREIVSNVAAMDQDASDDPFWHWVRKVQGWDR